MSLPEPPTIQHCYRHPDRETGRRCTRCGKPACSDCLVQATVGSHCLDCAKAARPDVKTRAKLATSGVLTPATYAIIGLNVLVFVVMMLADTHVIGGNLTQAQVDYGIWPASMFYNGEWYRLVTSGFVHFGIVHLGFNMYGLYTLGQRMERELPTLQYVLLYMAALLGGSLGTLVVEGTSLGVSAGASGAVFGLFGAAGIGLYRRGINVMDTGIGLALGVNLFITFSNRNISIGGHLGGLVAGAVCGYFMLAPGWKAFPKWVSYAAPIAVSLLAVVGSIVVVNSLGFPSR